MNRGEGADPHDIAAADVSSDPPSGADTGSERSRHREDVVVRRHIARPALVLLCAVLVVALGIGGWNLLPDGHGDDVVTSTAVRSEGAVGGEDDAGVEVGSDGATRTGGGAGTTDEEDTSPQGAPGVASATGHTGGAGAGAAGGGTASAHESGVLTVHVIGEVKDPSVVTLSPGARVMDAVAAAGGFTPRAVKDRINLAQPVSDGAQITIPNAENADRVAEAATQDGSGNGSADGAQAGETGNSGGTKAGGGAVTEGGAAAGGSPATEPGAAGKAGGAGAVPGSAPVNLNTASQAELETLPRVGPVLAQRILEFRTQHGPFTSAEQLDDVSGVGPAMLEALLPLVTV
ncbi:ComEA family DNA-binding protein [Kocuria marina]|uniref:ComEA family DNA-binding protein n=1 Tax=Kocuria marina TaxID=223184 RepID=UPI0022E7A25A|nr:ComEA family DNA-binding protein [Kocuria marina]